MKDELSLDISEIFYSIQGESTFAGYPCVFIRLAGCNLRCTYCDAAYTYEEESVPKNIENILAFVDEYAEAIVEITGGEPLLQENVYPLMDRLIQKERSILLETNGSISLADVPPQVTKIIDVKSPASGMHEHFHAENLNLISAADELKFVICSRNDYDWAKKMIQKKKIKQRVKNILFSPVPEKLAPVLLAEWILADRLPVRLQLQLHKILWPKIARGV